jgi:hypothetical protein
MPWYSFIPVIVSVITALVAAANYALVQSVKLSMAEMRLEIANGRAQDRDETRAWINGSFLRAREVEEKFRGLEHRIEEVERS